MSREGYLLDNDSTVSTTGFYLPGNDAGTVPPPELSRTLTTYASSSLHFTLFPKQDPVHNPPDPTGY